MKQIDTKSVIIGLLFGICVMLVMGQKETPKEKPTDLGSKVYDVIRAKKVGIVNNEGKEVLLLSTTMDNSGGNISIYNKSGNCVISLWTIKEDGTISINNNSGKSVVTLETIEQGGHISIYDKTSKNFTSAVSLHSLERGGYIGINNKTTEEVISLEVDEYGNGKIGAWDRKGKGRTLQPGR